MLSKFGQIEQETVRGPLRYKCNKMYLIQEWKATSCAADEICGMLPSLLIYLFLPVPLDIGGSKQIVSYIWYLTQYI